MPLNKDAVAAAQKELVAKNSGGGDFIRPSKLAAGDHDFRILPPLPHMNGIYFIEEQVWWINQKPYVSAKSFDKNALDVIAEEIEAAKAAKDPELDMLLNAKAAKGGKMVDLKTRYILPVLMLEVDGTTVKENKAQVLDAGPQLMMNINRVVSSSRITDVTDPETGRNLVIVKTGSGIDTEYACNAWGDPSAIDHKWLKDMPDVTKIHEENRRTDEHLRSVICNYLYGDPIIEDTTPKVEKKTATVEEPAPAEPRTRTRAAAPAAPAEPVVTPRTRTRAAATAAPKARNIVSDINDLDDDK